MKYCPNPSCRTLIDLGIVAEYEDHVVYCVDCGTELISADTPPQITPQPIEETPLPVEESGEQRQPTARTIKICPNPDCPTLVELGFVAEYEENVVYCEDCGTLLVSEESAPEESVPEDSPQPRPTTPRPRDFGEEYALLASFVSQEDVDVCLQKGELLGIPITVTETTITLDMAEEGSDEAAVVPAFDLTVRRQDLFRAMNMLVEIFGEDADEDDEQGGSIPAGD